MSEHIKDYCSCHDEAALLKQADADRRRRFAETCDRLRGEAAGLTAYQTQEIVRALWPEVKL